MPTPKAMGQGGLLPSNPAWPHVEATEAAGRGLK